MCELKKITDNLSYLPASDNPLSADVFVIRGQEYSWIYDVGNSEQALRLIQGIEGKKAVVLSHFHSDHSGNLAECGADKVYAGSHTLKYIGEAVAVENDIWIEDGVKLHIFPLACSHAKGSVGLELDECYAMLGDAIYPQEKKGGAVYNVQLLREEIDTLKALNAAYFLISHRRNPLIPKQMIIKKLETTYEKRDKNEAYIRME